MEGTMSEIRLFAGPFAPKTWAYCQGQTLAINTNQALFSLLGTTYGGNGVTTFCLPNMSSRIPAGAGTGPGLSTVALGMIDGSESITMNINQMPAHMHTGIAVTKIPALADGGNTGSPDNANLASLQGLYAPSTVTPDTTLATISSALAVAPTGGNQPIPVLQPFLAMNYVICLQGVYPSRN